MTGAGGGREGRDRPRGQARPPAAAGPRRPGGGRGREQAPRSRGPGGLRRVSGPARPGPQRFRPGWADAATDDAPRGPASRRGLSLGDPARRLRLGLLAMGFALSIVAGRLVQMQGLDAAAYRTLAKSERLTAEITPAERGEITTADGTILAMTEETDTVTADPPQIVYGLSAKAAGALLQRVADALAGPLRTPAASILSLLKNPTSPDYVVLAKGVPATSGNRVTSLMSKLNVGGIDLLPSYVREYPAGNLAANLVGFTSSLTKPVRLGGVSTTTQDLAGEAGIEESYNALLAGRDGKALVETGANGQQLPVNPQLVTPMRPGGDVRLTIQAGLQYQAQQACDAEVAKTHADGCTVVVIQPSTGKILAMAQSPGYDPAGVASLPSLAPTVDAPVASTFTPGSTAKVITAAAAMERGGQTPLSPYTVPYQIQVDGQWYHDADWHPLERLTLAGILVHSSNVGMVQVAQHVSPRVQYDYYRKFGIGMSTGLPLPGETDGIFNPPSRWNADHRFELSFGQGVAVNAVQMADVYAAIANGGVLVEPSIVAGATGPDGRYRPSPPTARHRVVSASTARSLIRILQQVPYLDAIKAYQPWGDIQGYSVAAKTGTAQEPGAHCPPSNPLCVYGSSYVGIAPASSPKLVVAVNVQNPRVGGYYGNAVAGPVFYQVMRFALQTLRIPPDGGKRPRVPLNAP